jgi:hypothetical protein
MKHEFNNRRLRVSSSVLWMGVATVLFGLCGCDNSESDRETPISLRLTGSQVEQAEQTNTKETPEPSQATANSQSGLTVEVGTFSGVITYDGPLPELPLIVKRGDTKTKDAAVCAAHDVPDESLLVNSAAGNGVANVFVYLRKAPTGTKSPVPDGPVVMDQKGCIFLPHAMLVRVGQRVLVKSDDAVPHNVHTFPLRNQPLNSIVAPDDPVVLTLVYQRSEPIPLAVKCDLHPWMRTYHLVLDHPFMAVTDSEGRFEIKNLPVGKHKFRIWHERAAFLERSYEVEIKADETKEISLTFAAEKFAVGR